MAVTGQKIWSTPEMDSRDEHERADQLINPDGGDLNSSDASGPGQEFVHDPSTSVKRCAHVLHVIYWCQVPNYGVNVNGHTKS